MKNAATSLPKYSWTEALCQTAVQRKVHRQSLKNPKMGFGMKRTIFTITEGQKNKDWALLTNKKTQTPTFKIHVFVLVARWTKIRVCHQLGHRIFSNQVMVLLQRISFPTFFPLSASYLLPLEVKVIKIDSSTTILARSPEDFSDICCILLPTFISVS